MANWRGLWLFLEGRNSSWGDQVRSVWITFMKEILCFVRTTSIQTERVYVYISCDLWILCRCENDTDTGYLCKLFISILHAVRWTANVTTTSRTCWKAETAKTDGTFRTRRSWRWSSEVLRYDFNTPPNGKVQPGQSCLWREWWRTWLLPFFAQCTIQSFGNMKLEFKHGMFTHVSPNNYYHRKHLVSSV